MVIDLNRCIGCWACAVACKAENSIGAGLWWQRVHTVGGTVPDTSKGSFPHLGKHYEPKNCFHCADPPCLPACPVDAITKRDDGIVLIDYDTCIGCGYCVVACPYDVIEMNTQPPLLPPGLEDGHGAEDVHPRPSGVVEKCTFCSHRVDQGLQPACVDACPTDVITFGDVADPTSEASQKLADSRAFRVQEKLGADPSVWYLAYTKGSHQRRSAPRQASDPS